MPGPYWIGVDLGGTKILVGLFDDAFKVVARPNSTRITKKAARLFSAGSS